MAEPNKYAQSLDKFYNVFDGPATFFRGTFRTQTLKKLPSFTKIISVKYEVGSVLADKFKVYQPLTGNSYKIEPSV